MDGVNSSDLDALSVYLQEEVGGPSFFAEIPLGIDNAASMFAALTDDCVASRIDTHPSVGVFRSNARGRQAKKFRSRLCSQISGHPWT